MLFDFTGSSNVSKVIRAADLVKQQWFLNALHFQKPIDLFVMIYHNPPRRTASTSSLDFPMIPSVSIAQIFQLQFSEVIRISGFRIRRLYLLRNLTFLQRFRQVLNPVRLLPIKKLKAPFMCITQLKIGHYCETLGWLSMSGIKSPSFSGKINPHGPNPTRRAIKVMANGTARASGNLPSLSSHAAYYPSISSIFK